MKGWLFPYGIWYALAAWAALGSASAAAGGGVLWASADGVVAVTLATLATRSQARWSRSGEKALRAELARLVDERAGSGAPAWLNRDARLLFTPDRRRVAGMRERSLMVMDEELLRDVNDARLAGGGRVAATFTSYRAHPAFPGVARRVDGLPAMVTAADVEDAAPGAREPWRQRHLGALRALRSGCAFTDLDELAEVVAQFRDAEPVSPDDQWDA